MTANIKRRNNQTMPIFVQYNDDGTIHSVVRGDKAPPHPRQIAFKDPPPPPKWTDVTDYRDEQAPPDILGKRVNLETMELEPCPRIAAMRQNAPVHARLNELDAKTTRALREEKLTGDSTALQNIETEAAELRKKLVAVPEA